MLMALNSLAAVHTKPTIKTTKQILNYSATHPDTVTEYRISGTILHIYSDESHKSKPEAQIRAGRYFFLGPKYNTMIQSMPPPNGPVNV